MTVTAMQDTPAESTEAAPSSLSMIPQVVRGPNDTQILVLRDDQLNEHFSPPGMSLPICGYMDSKGDTHYEINAAAWAYPKGWRALKILFRKREFFMAAIGEHCNRSLTRDPQSLIGAGSAQFYQDEKRLHLSFLGLRPAQELPHLSTSFRKEAIFRFQRSFDRLAVWLGATHSTTYTNIISDSKMQAIGWTPTELASWRQKWDSWKWCFPIGLFGKIRTYEVKY